MKYIQLLIISFCLTAVSFAQTNTFPSTGAAGIGTTTPNASSLLEIKSTTKGLLIPRMTKTQRNAIASPATSLLIYQTNSTPGFYYYTGSTWKAVSSSSNNWSLTGNSGTTSSDFLGTTDVQPLRFRVNNKNSGIIDYNLGTAAFGYLAFNSNTATGNTGVGYEAGFTNTTGQSNTAIGSNTLLSNTTGSQNTATGYFALFSNHTGNYNVADGEDALAGNDANNNTAIGALSLHANTSGVNNAALGYHAGYDNTTAGNNTFIGASSGGGNTSGSSNTFIGYNAGTSSGNGSNNICIGASAAVTNNASNSIVIGNGITTAQNYAIILGNTPNPFGENQVGIGTTAPASGNKMQVVTALANGIYSTSSDASGNGIVAEANGTSIPYAVWGKTSNTNLGQAGYFNGNVTYTGTLTGPSDERLKENINAVNNALTIVNELKPRSYNFKNEFSSMNLAKGKQFGFIAQDVEKVLPELVVTNYDKSKDIKNPAAYKALNYIGFIPILTAAMQELSQKNDALEKENNNLQARVTKLEALINQLLPNSIQNENSNVITAKNTNALLLQQNIPNPFNQSSSIHFYIPPNTSDASIVVTDATGKTIKQFNNLSKGNGTVTVEANTLSSGSYLYSLIVDGKTIATKQMILTK